jgi:XTP/dITP diphosphohydrolase
VKVRLVSRNEHKLHELRALLPDWELDLLDAPGAGEETGATYYENALAKARCGRTSAGPDAWVLGEDSGLEVSALAGRPGIRSARYAGPGEDANAKLLQELAEVGRAGRRAQYRCELVCLSPGEEEFRGTGLLEGSIADAPRGSEGFGYDPIFVPDGESRTVAELGGGWKRRNSHRARAARALNAAVVKAAPGL